MTKKQKTKQKFSIYWLFGKIGDILFVPVLLISLISSTSMLIQRRQNKPTAFFGYSLVNILTGSMTDAGLKKGDTVLTTKTSVQDIQLGDVIAFYELRNDPTDNKPKVLVERFKSPGSIKTLNPDNEIIYSDDNITISTYEKVEKESALTIEDAQKKNKRIIFHMVIGIYVDEDGSVFYETKGTNSGIDNPVRSDFVIGEYVTTPRFIRDIISFCSSSMGMILLVCIPLSILVMLQSFSLIKQIEEMNYEKQLLSGKKHFTDEELRKNFNGNNMETYNKVYLYFASPKEEQPELLNFMWSDILEKDNLSRKEEKLYNTLNIANTKLKKSKKAYWETWIENTRGFNHKKLKSYYQEALVYDVLNESKGYGSAPVTIVEPTKTTPVINIKAAVEELMPNKQPKLQKEAKSSNKPSKKNKTVEKAESKKLSIKQEKTEDKANKSKVLEDKRPETSTKINTKQNINAEQIKEDKKAKDKEISQKQSNVDIVVKKQEKNNEKTTQAKPDKNKVETKIKLPAVKPNIKTTNTIKVDDKKLEKKAQVTPLVKPKLKTELKQEKTKELAGQKVKTTQTKQTLEKANKPEKIKTSSNQVKTTTSKEKQDKKTSSVKEVKTTKQQGSITNAKKITKSTSKKS